MKWRKAETIYKQKKWHSTPMVNKSLLLAVPGMDVAQKGRFMGGLVQEFYIDGSPSTWKPTHWMPLPTLPTAKT